MIESMTLEQLRNNPRLIEIQEGEFVWKDAYCERAWLSYDYDEDVETDSLEEQIEYKNDNKFPDVPDGTYQVWAHHTLDQKTWADSQVGFTATTWRLEEEICAPDKTLPIADIGLMRTDANGIKKYKKNIWINSASCFIVEVKDGVICPNKLAEAIRDAHARSGYWGEFYEGVSFDTELNGFLIRVGS